MQQKLHHLFRNLLFQWDPSITPIGRAGFLTSGGVSVASSSSSSSSSSSASSSDCCVALTFGFSVATFGGAG